MSQLLERSAATELVTLTRGAPAGGEEEKVTSSLAEWIVEFDLSPYLGGPLRDAWDLMQSYPLFLAVVLVTIGYDIARLLKSIIHYLLDRLRKSTRFDLDYQIAHYLTSPVSRPP